MRYKDLGGGRYEALEKHRLADDSARQLESMLPEPLDDDPTDSTRP